MTASRLIAASFTVTIVASLALAAVYVAGGHPQLEGALLAAALGGLGVGMIVWAKHLFPDEPEVDERPRLISTEEDRRAFARSFERGEMALTRRRLLTRLLLAGLGALGLAALFPLRSLGPNPGRDLFHTPWRRGSRVVTEGGRPVRLGDLAVGTVITVFPEGHLESEEAATLLIRVEPDALELEEPFSDWAPLGHVAYSKICTHVGCPVGLYQEDTHQLLCPCHQSTFNVLEGAVPVFGPATRPLPQLPLGIDDDGYFVALADYQEPVGPAFWNRGWV